MVTVVLYPADGSTSVTESGRAAAPGKNMKQTSRKKEGTPVTSSVATDKKSGDRALEKERKKDAPPPRMQFDDKTRVEKAKRRAVVNQTEARNRVELFRHLPQYEHGTQLPELESKLFQLDPVHPSVFKVLFCSFISLVQQSNVMASTCQQGRSIMYLEMSTNIKTNLFFLVTIICTHKLI